jgi:hypothetical protein
MDGAPGRGCPLSYRYGAAALRRAPEIAVDSLWVAGGLYGNRFALARLLELFDAEPGSKALVFNGDFHWFDVEPAEFRAIDDGVHRHLVTRGNVETELAEPAQGAGCGCAYPEFVDHATVERSNRIIERLRDTARGFPASLARLASAPMHLVAEVGGERVAVVHGDADSLAGWGFSQERLAEAAGTAAAARAFEAAGARVFASSHSCLPVLQGFAGERLVANNGSAGMPNFRGIPAGLATRIAVTPSRSAAYGARAGVLHVEAVAIDYDAAAWEKAFLRQWPAGSDAWRSYHERIVHGPSYRLEQALRRATALAA